jgi:hypothetical protein
MSLREDDRRGAEAESVLEGIGAQMERSLIEPGTTLSRKQVTIQ